MDKGRALSDAPASAWEVADQTELDQRSNQTRDYLKLGVPLVVSIDNARLYPRRLKHLVTALVAVCGLAMPLGSNTFLRKVSSLLTPGASVNRANERAAAVLAPAARDLHTTPMVMNLSIAFYCLAVAITPMWWATLSEHRGKRMTYIVAFSLFIVFNLAAALSVSPAMFIAMRLLAGATSAPVQTLGAGSVADLWDLKERGRAMGIFLLGAMTGNIIGPIVGGALGSRWSWRSTQYFMVIYGGVVWLWVVFFLPETSAAGRSRRGPADESGSRMRRGVLASAAALCLRILVTLAKPIQLIQLLRFPPILITVCYTGINFAAYYFVMIVIQAIFSTKPYSYSEIIVGLLYLPNAAGSVLAATLGGRWTDRVMVRKAIAAGRLSADQKPEPKPQDALGLNVWSAALLFPAAILVSGWTAERVMPVSLVANFFFAVGNMLVQNVTTVTLTEYVPGRPAAGVALSNLVRNTLGAVACIVTQPLLNAIGVGWLSTIVSILCGISAGCIWLLQRNATRWASEMADKM